MLISATKLATLFQVWAMFSIPLFFSIMGIMNIDYLGADSSPVYIIYIIVTFVLSTIGYLYSCLKFGILKYESHFILFISFLIATHFLWIIFDPINNGLQSNSLILFVTLGLPGFFAAATILKTGKLIYSIKLTEVAIIIIALGVLLYSIIPSLRGTVVNNLAGASYQALSYYSAFCFGVLLTYHSRLPNELRFGFTSSKLYNIIIYIFLISCIIGTLLGGGRGALILLIAYLLIYFLSFLDYKNWIESSNKFIKYLFKLALYLLLFFFFTIFFWNNEFIQNGFKRATQFIGSEGQVDLDTGGSGRDIVYSTAINYIYERSLIGYGPFGANDNTVQAHNIFLDITLQFGYIGLVIYLIIFFYIIIIARKNWSIYSYWALALTLYPIVMLMFSGYYLHMTIFIFGISFFYMYRDNNNVIYRSDV